MLLENLVLGALFFLLVPGILVTLPRGGSKFTVAFVHAVVFVLAYMVLQYVADYGGYGYAVYDDDEGAEEGFGGGGGGKRWYLCEGQYDCTTIGGGWKSGRAGKRHCKCTNSKYMQECSSTSGKCYY